MKVAFPSPRIKDTLDALAVQFLLLLFWLLGTTKLRREKRTEKRQHCETSFGHYQHLRCPMGLTNTPATFQVLMEHVFSDYIFVTLFVYLDDLDGMLLFSKSVEEHLERLEAMLGLLQKHGLKLKPSVSHT